MDDKYGHYHIKPRGNFWQSVKQVLILYRYQVILMVFIPAAILGALNTWLLWDVLTHRAALTAGMLAFIAVLGIGFVGALYADWKHSEKRQKADDETWKVEERR